MATTEQKKRLLKAKIAVALVSTMLIGYARVSTADQAHDLQEDALEKAGCERIFTDTVSGAKEERTGLNEAMSHLREGDTLVVWRLDRLGRSLKHLVESGSVRKARERPCGLWETQEAQAGPEARLRAREQPTEAIHDIGGQLPEKGYR